MENKKLIKRIKKEALKQFEADIKDSVLKELYGNASKKQLKKLKKKILRELQEDIFGTQNKKLPKGVEEIKKLAESQTEAAESPEETVEETQDSNIVEYAGFKFDRNRMSSLVTGKVRKDMPRTESTKRVDENVRPRSYRNPILDIMTENTAMDTAKSDFDSAVDSGLINRLKRAASNPISDTSINLMQSMPAPEGLSSEDFFNRLGKETKIYAPKELKPEITKERKEELEFFIGKLKESVSKLRKDEKNISFRKKQDKIYNFNFERKADFDLKFNLDLDLYTYGVNVNVFEFKVDGFKFDKKSFELLDIVQVLDLIGFNLSKHINEIIDINESSAELKKAIKENLKNNAEEIRDNYDLSKFIFDKKIVRVLNSNDINTYEQLKRIEDFTSLRGVGPKTAEKIDKYIKD